VFSAFSWFIAAGLGAVIYLAVADRSRNYVDVSGESIAVESNH
jgi:NCS1 family nucleobase:cation symporter-1